MLDLSSSSVATLSRKVRTDVVLQRKREEELARHTTKKRRQSQASQWLQQLNQSMEPLRPEERRLSVEVEALVRSCFSAFSLTDKNYLGLTTKSLTQDCAFQLPPAQQSSFCGCQLLHLTKPQSFSGFIGACLCCAYQLFPTFHYSLLSWGLSLLVPAHYPVLSTVSCLY